MILLIIVIVLLVYLIYIIFYDIFYYYKLLKRYYYSFMRTCDFGYLIAVSGAIRKGKTILMHAITHVLVLKIKQDLRRKMYEIETKLIEVNFEEIKHNFTRYSEDGLSLEVIQDKLIELFKVSFNGKITYINNLNEHYFDGIQYFNKISMIKSYISYYYHHRRIDHVFSNIKSWNQITCSYSLDFKDDWKNLKNNWKKNNKHFEFPLVENSVFNYDEQLLNNKNDNDAKRQKEESGSDIFYRLFGQIFKESSYYITTLQDVERWFKTEREIMTTFPYVNNSIIVYSKPKLFNLFMFLESINNWIYDKLHKNVEFRAEENRFKKRNLWLLKQQEKILSKSFISFDLSIYDKVDNVGKLLKPDDMTESQYNSDFIFPICYCWNGNTHAFYKIYEYIKKRNILNRFDLKATEIDDEFIENMLLKYDEKVNKESSDTTDVQDFSNDYY